VADASKFWRQLDLCNPDKLTRPVIIIGAGAIGSAAAVTLSKLGCSDITVYDADLLEVHNAPNQMCIESKLGVPKVEALGELVKLLSGVEIKEECRMWDGEGFQASSIVVCAVDNMRVRTQLWEVINFGSVGHYIDARMGAELLLVYSLDPSDIDHTSMYEGTLHDDSEAEELPCSARSIIYCPAIAGAMIAHQVKAICMEKPYHNEIIFDIPTLTLASNQII